MRPLEALIPFSLSIYLLWQPPRPLIVRLFTGVALVLLILQLGIEGYRWQMIPIYALTALLVLGTLTPLRSATDLKPLASYLTFTLLIISTALPILLPVPHIPTPGGPYKVGTRIYELIDPSRKEIYSDRAEARRFMVQIWYPSEPVSSDAQAPWMANANIYAPAIATHIGLPSFFLNHLALVKVPAYQESKVASTHNGYPIILFSHGWQGFNAQNTGQALELASHGYIVLGVQHTYGAVVTVFPDGTVAENNPSALPEEADDPNYEQTAQKLVDQWAGDLGFALDFMQMQNNESGSPFYKTLDLSHVGVYGHSTGGGAGIEFCGRDRRCKAVLGMDPFMRPVSYQVIDNGVRQPAFFMFSQRWADDVDSRNNELFRRFIPNVEQSFGVITISGTAHYDFTDLPLLSPLAPQLGLKGPINGKRVTAIVNDYLLSFFEATLGSEATNLFNGQAGKYQEVRAIQ